MPEIISLRGRSQPSGGLTTRRRIQRPAPSARKLNLRDSDLDPGTGPKRSSIGRCRPNTRDRPIDPRHRKSPAQAHDQSFCTLQDSTYSPPVLSRGIERKAAAAATPGTIPDVALPSAPRLAAGLIGLVSFAAGMAGNLATTRIGRDGSESFMPTTVHDRLPSSRSTSRRSQLQGGSW